MCGLSSKLLSQRPVAAPQRQVTSLLARGGNFDAMRLVAASAVILGHSLITTGAAQHPLFHTCAIAAVETFFIISGYLVTQSFVYSRSWARFVLARSLRIFPALLGCILLSALLLGPALTKLSLADYFRDQKLFQFVIYNSLLENDLFMSLPGVMFHPFKKGTIINGSLWTLALEFTFYAIVLIFGVLRRLNGRSAAVLLALTLFSLTFHVLSGYTWFLSYFAAGMLMFFVRKRQRLNGWVAWLAVPAVLLGSYGLIPWALIPPLGAYFIIYVAVDAPFQIKNATRFGDLSYGIYLYGWPCQGLAAHMLGGQPPWWQIFLLALPSAAALACLSWHAVERPALRWKDADLSGLRQRIGLAAVIAYSSAAIFFGIGFKLFGFGCLLPAALALIGGQTLFWVDKAGLTARLWFGSRNLAATAEGVRPSSASSVAPASVRPQ